MLIMNIEILHLIEGAKKAKGVTVVIDVFRAFTVEAYVMSRGAKKIIKKKKKKKQY